MKVFKLPSNGAFPLQSQNSKVLQRGVTLNNQVSKVFGKADSMPCDPLPEELRSPDRRLSGIFRYECLGCLASDRVVDLLPDCMMLFFEKNQGNRPPKTISFTEVAEFESEDEGFVLRMKGGKVERFTGPRDSNDLNQWHYLVPKLMQDLETDSKEEDQEHPQYESESRQKHILQQGLLTLYKRKKADVRYFVLQQDILAYYVSEEDFLSDALGKNARGHVALSEVEAITFSDDGFTLCLEGQQVRLGIQQAEDLEQWRMSLQEVLGNKIGFTNSPEDRGNSARDSSRTPPPTTQADASDQSRLARPAGKAAISVFCEGRISLERKGKRTERYMLLFQDEFRLFVEENDYMNGQDPRVVVQLTDIAGFEEQAGQLIITIRGQAAALAISAESESQMQRWADAFERVLANIDGVQPQAIIRLNREQRQQQPNMSSDGDDCEVNGVVEPASPASTATPESPQSGSHPVRAQSSQSLQPPRGSSRRAGRGTMTPSPVSSASPSCAASVSSAGAGGGAAQGEQGDPGDQRSPCERSVSPSSNTKQEKSPFPLCSSLVFEAESAVAKPSMDIKFEAREYGKQKPDAPFKNPIAVKSLISEVYDIYKTFQVKLEVVRTFRKSKMDSTYNPQLEKSRKDQEQKRVDLIAKALCDLGLPSGAFKARVEEVGNSSKEPDLYARFRFGKAAARSKHHLLGAVAEVCRRRRVGFDASIDVARVNIDAKFMTTPAAGIEIGVSEQTRSALQDIRDLWGIFDCEVCVVNRYPPIDSLLSSGEQEFQHLLEDDHAQKLRTALEAKGVATCSSDSAAKEALTARGMLFHFKGEVVSNLRLDEAKQKFKDNGRLDDPCCGALFAGTFLSAQAQQRPLPGAPFDEPMMLASERCRAAVFWDRFAIDGGGDTDSMFEIKIADVKDLEVTSEDIALYTADLRRVALCLEAGEQGAQAAADFQAALREACAGSGVALPTRPTAPAPASAAAKPSKAGAGGAARSVSPSPAASRSSTGTKSSKAATVSRKSSELSVDVHKAVASTAATSPTASATSSRSLGTTGSAKSKAAPPAARRASSSSTVHARSATDAGAKAVKTSPAASAPATTPSPPTRTNRASTSAVAAAEPGCEAASTPSNSPPSNSTPRSSTPRSSTPLAAGAVAAPPTPPKLVAASAIGSGTPRGARSSTPRSQSEATPKTRTSVSPRDAGARAPSATRPAAKSAQAGPSSKSFAGKTKVAPTHSSKSAVRSRAATDARAASARAVASKGATRRGRSKIEDTATAIATVADGEFDDDEEEDTFDNADGYRDADFEAEEHTGGDEGCSPSADSVGSDSAGAGVGIGAKRTARVVRKGATSDCGAARARRLAASAAEEEEEHAVDERDEDATESLTQTGRNSVDRVASDSAKEAKLREIFEWCDTGGAGAITWGALAEACDKSPLTADFFQKLSIISGGRGMDVVRRQSACNPDLELTWEDFATTYLQVAPSQLLRQGTLDFVNIGKERFVRIYSDRIEMFEDEAASRSGDNNIVFRITPADVASVQVAATGFLLCLLNDTIELRSIAGSTDIEAWHRSIHAFAGQHDDQEEPSPGGATVRMASGKSKPSTASRKLVAQQLRPKKQEHFANSQKWEPSHDFVQELSSSLLAEWVLGQADTLLYHGVLGMAPNRELAARYCILFQDRFVGYKRPLDVVHGRRPQLTISIGDLRSVDHLGNGFILQGLSKTHSFHARTPHELDAWVDNFAELIDPQQATTVRRATWCMPAPALVAAMSQAISVDEGGSSSAATASRSASEPRLQVTEHSSERHRHVKPRAKGQQQGNGGAGAQGPRGPRSVSPGIRKVANNFKVNTHSAGREASALIMGSGASTILPASPRPGSDRLQKAWPGKPNEPMPALDTSASGECDHKPLVGQREGYLKHTPRTSCGHTTWDKVTLTTPSSPRGASSHAQARVVTPRGVGEVTGKVGREVLAFFQQRACY